MGQAVRQLEHHRGNYRVEVVARDRPAEAHQLHLTGLDWTSIASQTGYASGRVAAQAVGAWLQKIAIEQAPEHRRQALDLELDRLDAVQSAFWSAAMGGDRHAAEVVLKVIARRCKILGFEKPADMTETPRTIVIGGTSEQYVAGLKALIADGDTPCEQHAEYRDRRARTEGH